MDAEKYLKELTRMCKYYEENCAHAGCPLADPFKGNAKWCPFVSNEEDEYVPSVKIVEEWAESNPVMTNGRKFHETFGILHGDNLGEITFSESEDGRYCGYVSATKPVTLICVSQDWWNEEYKEP